MHIIYYQISCWTHKKSRFQAIFQVPLKSGRGKSGWPVICKRLIWVRVLWPTICKRLMWVDVVWPRLWGGYTGTRGLTNTTSVIAVRTWRKNRRGRKRQKEKQEKEAQLDHEGKTGEEGQNKKGRDTGTTSQEIQGCWARYATARNTRWSTAQHSGDSTNVQYIYEAYRKCINQE